tara:strand:- start:12 stop:584 length:573 start_codon:yes stop_codon:yes gene_type:complete
MTPRLKILSIGLALSLVYSIYDYVERNKSNKPKTAVAKKSKKRARTAGVSKARYDNLKKKWAREGIGQNKNEESKSESSSTTDGFLPLSAQVSNLDGWDRNPFVKVYEPQAISKPRTTQDIILDEEPALSSLDGLVIETAVRMGEKAFVTINGQTFTEGDLINDAMIEKIENEQITFKVGKTRIIKDVGT